MAGNRVVAVALDAMEVSWLERLTARGELPNLAAFMRAGHGARVRSDGATLHGAIWPTFASGTGPGSHGRYFWLQWLAEEMRYVRSSHPAFAYEPFWQGLAAAGRRVTVVDIPYTPLVRHERVEQVVGWGVSDEVDTGSWPAGALDRLRREIGRHPLSLDTVEPHNARDLVAMVNSLARGFAMRARLIERLAADRSLDLAIVNCGETHKAGHYLAEEKEIRPGVTNLDLIGRVLAPLDAAWPGIIAAAGEETTIILFALHGMEHQVDFSILGKQVAAVALGRDVAAAVPRADLIRRIRDAIPDPVHRFVWDRLPASVRAARQAQLEQQGVLPGADPVFTVGYDGDAAFRLSIRGREARGVIDREDSGAWLARVEQAALGFRTPDGVQVFADLLRIAEAFHGPRVDRLPDGLLRANRDLARVTEAIDDAGRRLVNPLPERRNGVHTGRGFCFVRPGRSAGFALPPEVDVRDFAPTFYGLLGVPPKGGFEGRAFAGRAPA
jgi:predicted AlkP superfamily phosphohydrolase/phosphomutase